MYTDRNSSAAVVTRLRARGPINLGWISGGGIRIGSGSDHYPVFTGVFLLA
jgi:hypothetical protein